MVKDRLEELQKKLSRNSNDTEALPDKNGNIFQRFEVIQKWIQLLENQTQTCQHVYAKDIKPTEMHKKLKEIFVQSETISAKIATSLKQIKIELNQSADKNSADFRMKLVQYTSAVNKFKTAVDEQETWMQKIYDAKKNFVQKCYQIVNNEELSEGELEQLMTDNPSVFTQDYMHSDLEARRQLLDVEERHKELTAIEERLVEIRDLFFQIATLVELQQDSVNTIEYIVATATDYVDDAATQLNKAKKNKKRSRKLKTIILIVLIVIIVIVLLSIFV